MNKITRIQCPLCEWHYDRPFPDPGIDNGTLATQFGPGVFAAVASHNIHKATEETLNKHFKTHTILEWVTKITALQRQIALLNFAAIVPEGELTQCDGEDSYE